MLRRSNTRLWLSSFLIRAGGDQGCVHVDDQSPGQGLPGDGQSREPGGRVHDQRQTCARALARARAIRSSMASVPAMSRARQVVGPLGASPSTGARCASTAISFMLVAASTIAAAIDTSAIPRSSRGELPAFRSAALRPTVSPPGRRPCGAGPRRCAGHADPLGGALGPGIPSLARPQRRAARRAALRPAHAGPDRGPGPTRGSRSARCRIPALVTATARSLRRAGNGTRCAPP